jgi:hypothetical protein
MLVAKVYVRADQVNRLAQARGEGEAQVWDSDDLDGLLRAIQSAEYALLAEVKQTRETDEG